jgi:hypothetical protein
LAQLKNSYKKIEENVTRKNQQDEHAIVQMKKETNRQINKLLGEITEKDQQYQELLQENLRTKTEMEIMIERLTQENEKLEIVLKNTVTNQEVAASEIKKETEELLEQKNQQIISLSVQLSEKNNQYNLFTAKIRETE